MSTASPAIDPSAARARDWYRASHTAVCDSIEPWPHGMVVRASRYPTYYNYNLVRVEDEPGMDATALAAFADRALTGLEHRKLDFDEIDAAEARRAELTAAGWKGTRLLWMRHRQPPQDGVGIEVEQVAYEDVDELRLAWHLEESPESEYERYRIAAREVAMSREVKVLAVREQGVPIAFAQLEQIGDAAEITQVYVHPDRRGGGRGTAMTRAAILAAGDVSDLWIVADDEDRPKNLYARLGFQAAWTSMEFVLLS